MASRSLLEHPDAGLLHCRLSIQLKLVRDVAIPLGAFSNIVCTMHAPLLPRCSSGAASKRLVRTSPPVLLPRHGEVALPWPGCTRDFAVRGIDELLPALAEEPLAVELWHHDKYTQKVLLGVATVDVAEVLSVRPIADGERTAAHRQEQTVSFVAPATVPAELSSRRNRHEHISGAQVALLDLVLRLELISPRAPSEAPPQPTRRAVDGAGAHASRGSRRSARGSSMIDDDIDIVGISRRRDGEGASAAVPAATAAEAAAEAVARLAEWRRREHAKWKAGLEKVEAARLETLAREWSILEKRRAAEARAQCRAMAEVTKALQQKLRLLEAHEETIEQTAEELQLRGAALERHSENERAELLSRAEREQAALRAERDALAAQLRAAREHGAMLEQRNLELSALESKAETEAMVWKEAHSSAAKAAMMLESDKGQLAARLEQEQQERQVLKEAEERRRNEERRRLAAEAKAAAEVSRPI